jgi:hypothetical protein
MVCAEYGCSSVASPSPDPIRSDPTTAIDRSIDPTAAPSLNWNPRRESVPAPIPKHAGGPPGAESDTRLRDSPASKRATP